MLKFIYREPCHTKRRQIIDVDEPGLETDGK